MTDHARPAARPANPCFSSGPCAKRPGWSAAGLANALVGRSHRSKDGKARLKAVIDRTHRILGLPAGYRAGIMPASDTGAFEAAMWSLLGPRGIDVVAFESFGKGWAQDVLKELRLTDVRVLEADYGRLPDLSGIDFSRDVILTWNGTTSGVRVPDGGFIPDDRAGLVLCDATSAAFAQEIDWARIDVGTFSWQKALGGEAQHGMIILSPRALERLETYSPPWPVPKIFRLAKSGKPIEGIFAGETINTPSMLCVEDYADALDWVEGLGGLKSLVARADKGAGAVAAFAERSAWLRLLPERAETRSNTSVCLAFRNEAVPPERQAALQKAIVAILEKEGIAYDIGAYRDAPPGLRIWTGSTVEPDDVAALMPWLDWAYETAKAEIGHG
ncbi:MAG: phosphoserine transaminase [Hyphomicrobiaceae bacterium]